MRFFVYMYSGVVNFVMLVNRMSNIVSRNINVNAKGLAHERNLLEVKTGQIFSINYWKTSSGKPKG